MSIVYMVFDRNARAKAPIALPLVKTGGLAAG